MKVVASNSKTSQENDLTLAPIANVRLFSELMDRVVNRDPRLPGLATFHGFSGFGKTWAATKGANFHRAYYLEAGESWGRVKFLKSLSVELGLEPKGTIGDMVDPIIEVLGQSQRPLIIDEADYVFSRKYHELLREIHDKSCSPIILIGEELLPSKIAGISERFHNRVYDWVEARPADQKDVELLAKLYCKNVQVKPDLLDRLLKLSDGRVRRICVNLLRVNEYAKVSRIDAIGLAEWGDRELFSGRQPPRRAA
ncbi:MAG: AAA family ATPase [Alphaproteobacteria bacterium]